jgi:elongation factor G
MAVAIAGGVQMTSKGGEVHGVLSFAIGLISDEGRVALQHQLSTVIQAHPTFSIEVDALENGLIVRGDDELDLMEIREKITPEYEANIGELTISYKESIRRPAEAKGKYIRQTGGSGNYGHAKIRLEPNEPGKDVEFINEIKGDVVPKEYIMPIEHGIRKAALGGILAGYEVVDFKAILYDGSYHEADSNEMAFKIAGSLAFKEAARKANPVLLEPVMAVEVTSPEEHMGTTISDINSRRVRIEGMERTGGTQVIRAIIPLAEMLSSSEHGRPRYAMHFAGYQPAPPRHGQFGDDAGAHVRKPSSPKSGAGSAAAGLDD